MSNLLIPALVLCERWREEVREARRENRHVVLLWYHD